MTKKEKIMCEKEIADKEYQLWLYKEYKTREMFNEKAIPVFIELFGTSELEKVIYDRKEMKYAIKE
jgi:hypothetical protein